jgi:hypothetical protein
VIVNGVVVVDHGEFTSNRPGKVLRRSAGRQTDRRTGGR